MERNVNIVKEYLEDLVGEFYEISDSKDIGNSCKSKGKCSTRDSGDVGNCCG